MAAELPCYTLLSANPDKGGDLSEQGLKKELMDNDARVKADALKKIIFAILNGDKFPTLLMDIIRFVIPCSDHMVKKLLLIFWEVVPKTSGDGKLLSEMILVCDAYRKDLQHPNEFIRGSTLRFLCKLREPELLEPLMPAIRNCLEHRHSYVRRNAVLAIFTIYKNFDFLIPDAPEVMLSFLETEQDASCQRNAFMMLIHADQDKALEYLSSCIDQVHTFGDILQLVIVELVYRVCHSNPNERSRFIRCIFNLLQSNSPAVRYEAAGTLITLSSAPTAIKAVASCYVDLIVKESDNNVKLIVLDRLIDMKNPTSEKVLQEMIMDILRVLSSPDLEVRRKTLSLTMDLISMRNVLDVVKYLEKEIVKTSGATAASDETGKYRQLLVRALHSCCVKFPDMAGSVIPVLMVFLGDSNELAAVDVLVFVREAVSRFTDTLGKVIIEKLLQALSTIRSAKIHRQALWILGEYCTSPSDIQAVMTEIRQSLGELPIVEDELKKKAGDEALEDETVVQSAKAVQPVVTADGTYATQSAFTDSAGKSGSGSRDKEPERPPLRKYLMDGDFFIATAIGTTLSKLALKYAAAVKEQKRINRFNAESMLVLSSILHLGRSGMPTKAITEDDFERVALCLRILANKSDKVTDFVCMEGRKALVEMLEAQSAENLADDLLNKGVPKNKGKGDTGTAAVQADSAVAFPQLAKSQDVGDSGHMLDVVLSQALGTAKDANPTDFSSTKLSKITQLTGFSDPIYAEAYVNVNQYDIVLDVLMVNQTADTLQSVSLELATLGDLKLVEKPQPLVLAPFDFCNIKANVKVTSTENGIIFGNIVYDVTGAVSDRNVVILNDIHIDIMDYIVPAYCSDTEFRQMWAEFEWENKVVVNTNITDLREYLTALLGATNMRSLTPEKALSGECGFMAANLYARSIFGEDALANVSLEKNPSKVDAVVTGHIRIRAKSQGMALSLGDKINNSQKIRLSASAKKPSRQSESVAADADKEDPKPESEE